MQIFEVGGCVRDELLGVPSKDIDFVVVLDGSEKDTTISGAPFKIMVDELERQGFRIFLLTPEFLTVRARFPRKSTKMKDDAENWNDFQFANPGLTADFVLARKEGTYTDGRRPDEVIPGTLHDDLSRRDFTMNAIAKDSAGNLIDPFNGQRDIENRIIRCVGNPQDRFEEDALRAVRAFRFAITKGFDIMPSVRTAMESYSVCDAIINKISDERIQIEISKAFRFNTRKAGTMLFGEFPFLANAVFAGNVSLDATMKTKGRGRA